jgi:FdhD protein
MFEACGGTHAVGLFDAAGELVAHAEDTGRHNALDKAIGRCLRSGRSPAGLGAELSGRVSLEMVGKCVRAGIEMISAISAPTSLAIEVAERCGLTLCAFVRESRATVFTHPQRVITP